MKPCKTNAAVELINLLDVDLDAIADPDDKIAECEYFLSLASNEKDLRRFRWLISAFLGAAYSFFEINGLRVYHAFVDEETGAPIEDPQALDILCRYVRVFQNKKRPLYVKTGGHHSITKRLYEIRKYNTHHTPMSIITAGPVLPEDFHFGYLTGKGAPALGFCRQVMELILQVHDELQL